MRLELRVDPASIQLIPYDEKSSVLKVIALQPKDTLMQVAKQMSSGDIEDVLRALRFQCRVQPRT